MNKGFQIYIGKTQCSEIKHSNKVFIEHSGGEISYKWVLGFPSCALQNPTDALFHEPIEALGIGRGRQSLEQISNGE